MNKTSIPARIPFWHNPEKRALVFQLLALVAVLLVGYYLFANTSANLRRQNIASGFGFLGKEAAFEIGESLIPYSAADTYGRALLVGVLNTLKVSFIGIILTVIIGTLVGIARLSSNWLLARLAAVYIEVLQDVPVLLQLFFWYGIFYQFFPPPRRALSPCRGVFISNRGLVFAVPAADPIHLWMAAALVAAVLGSLLLRRWARKRQAETGRYFPVFRVSLLLLLLLPLLTWLAGGAPTAMNTPVL